LIEQVVNACHMFEKNHLDLRLELEFTDLTRAPKAKLDIGTGCHLGNAPSSLRWFDPKAVNVYAVPGNVAENCGHERRAIYLSPGRPLGSLAHELGHALGLHGGLECAHADECPDRFQPDNLMWRGAGILQATITRNQLARMRCIYRSHFQAEKDDSKKVARNCDIVLQHGFKVWDTVHLKRSDKAYTAHRRNAGYSSERNMIEALEARHRALVEHSTRHHGCGRVSPIETFLRRHSKRYFAISRSVP
jgi:hypothetical protein